MTKEADQSYQCLSLLVLISDFGVPSMLDMAVEDVPFALLDFGPSLGKLFSIHLGIGMFTPRHFILETC